jgi:hypothetical protein
MALSAEDRAILELLHDRGLSYEEIDDLLGGEAGEARRRERAALAAITDEEAAELQVTPAPAGGEGWQRRGRIVLGVLAAVAVGVGAGAIVKGGSEGEGETTASEATAAAESAPEPVELELEPTGSGEGARGAATIGLDDQFAPYLDLDLEGLPPLPQGSIYVPWIELAADRGVPVPAPIAVRDGAFQGRLDLPPQLISVLDVGRELQVIPLGRAELEELTRELETAGRGGGNALRSPGGAVLSGSIPKR